MHICAFVRCSVASKVEDQGAPGRSSTTACQKRVACPRSGLCWLKHSNCKVFQCMTWSLLPHKLLQESFLVTRPT